MERVCTEIIGKAKSKEDVKVVGPIRLPTKRLDITCRKSPCGEGSKTWEKWEMKIYKRVINLVCTSADIKEITSIKIDPGVVSFSHCGWANASNGKPLASDPKQLPKPAMEN